MVSWKQNLQKAGPQVFLTPKANLHSVLSPAICQRLPVKGSCEFTTALPSAPGKGHWPFLSVLACLQVSGW
jgi:hypothetical protein